MRNVSILVYVGNGLICSCLTLRFRILQRKIIKETHVNWKLCLKKIEWKIIFKIIGKKSKDVSKIKFVITE